jgi:apolipoprotein N-acyltransferase
MVESISKQTKVLESQSWLTWLWLGVGGVLAIFSNGRWIIPVAAWLSPVFLLRFVRRQKPAPGLIVLAVLTSVIWSITWQEMIPMEGVLYYVLASSIGLVYWIPAYLADRLLSPHIKSVASTLIFPLAFTATELLFSLVSPYLTWGALAYTQYHMLALKQLASLTGIWGITFIVTWFASTVNWAWEHDFEWNTIKQGVGAYAGILVAVLLYGGARLVWDGPQSETILVAGLVMSDQTIPIWKEAAFGNPDQSEALAQTILDEYITRTRQQAQTRAEIVIWDESAIFATPAMEPDVIQRAQQLAKEEHIYLALTLYVKPPGEEGLAENKTLLISPEGETLSTYQKSIIVPGDEQIPGDGQLRFSDTPFGTLGTIVCFDLDRPSLVRQAGQSGVGMMLAPSDDWPAVDNLHAQMASFRAIENGFSMVRPTREGLSAAYDSRGRVLASVGLSTPDKVMIVNMPVGQRWALYPIIGDLFGWLSVAGLAALVGIGIVEKRRT